jgi:SAM-dependent methyltransferase
MNNMTNRVRLSFETFNFSEEMAEVEFDDIDAQVEKLLHCSPHVYSDPNYWDNRYSSQIGSFEWYDDYFRFEPEISPFLLNKSHVLHIGCGNSPMSIDLVKAGCQLVDCVDISRVVIEQMKQKYDATQNIRWYQADCMALPFPDATFDASFDKGTVDALLCSQTASKNVKAMCQEVIRTLKPKGVFVEISLGCPSDRLQYLEKPLLKWKLIHSARVSNSTDEPHFVYIFQKQD